MPLPWLQVLDVALGIADWRRRRRAKGSVPIVRAASGSRGLLDARIAGVIAAAVGDVFARDRRREERERERLEEEKREAERMRQLFLMRAIGDLEIGRLRLVAGLAVAGWVGSLLVTVMLSGAGPGPRVIVAIGWLLLLGALVTALHAQARLANALARLTDPDSRQPTSGAGGATAPWLVIAGLIFVAIAALTV